MSKCISSIHSCIIIRKIFICCIIRRIYINHFYFSLMRLFKQLERSKVVPLNKKIHLSAVINEKAFIFS